MSAERPTKKPATRPKPRARATATTEEAEVSGVDTAKRRREAAHGGDKLEAARARLGQRVGGYKLEDVLGVGGSACVYRGVKRGKGAAIKVLHAWLGADPRAKKRFVREATLAERVAHPAIVRTLDHGEEPDGTVFLVMDLAEGETIEARRIAAGGRLPEGEVMHLMDELLAVLAVTHARGVVHRDIKPTNLLRTPEGSLRLLDFGIACVTDLTEASSLVTRTGAVLGTVFFMAPEQALGVRDDIDASSDVWAVGATMFTLLTGQFVHQARTANEALVLAATQPAPPIRSLQPGVSAAMASVVDRALSFDRAARYADAGAMRDALRGAARGEMDAVAELAMIETLPETTGGERMDPMSPFAKSAPPTGAASRRARSWPAIAGAATRAVAMMRWPAIAGAATLAVAMMLFLFGRGSPRAGEGGMAARAISTAAATDSVEEPSIAPRPTFHQPRWAPSAAVAPPPSASLPASAKAPPPKPLATTSARATRQPAPSPSTPSPLNEPEPFF